MNKYVLLVLIWSFGMSAYAFPMIDNTAGSVPYSAIMQQNFVRTENERFKEFTDARERPVSSRSESPEKLKQEYKVQELRNRAPKFDLNNYRVDPSSSQEFVPQPMQLKEQDGKIYIKGIN